MSGVTTEGLEIKTLEQILDETNAEQLATISPTLDLSPDENLGQINAIDAKQLAELWEGLQVAYNAFNRGAAEGTLLENIGALTGTKRRAAAKGLVVLTCNLDAGTTLVAGTAKANVDDMPGNVWVLKGATGSGWSGNIFTAASTDDYLLTFEAQDFGHTIANAGTINTINTAVAGWNTVNNPNDAIPGSLEETDADYRLRQQDELSASGSCTVDATRADVLNVDGVLQCVVQENTTEHAVGIIPAKSYQVIVYDGLIPQADDDEIAQAIWNDKPAGISPVGLNFGTATDTILKTHEIAFTRAVQVPILIEIQVAIDENYDPVDTMAKVKAEIVARGLLQKMGDDVIALVYKAISFNIPGVRDVTSYGQHRDSDPFLDTNIAIDTTEIATIDSGDVDVGHVIFVDT